METIRPETTKCRSHYFRRSLAGLTLRFRSCSVEPTAFSCSKLHSSSTAPKLASVRFSRAAYFSSSARTS
jgi:hypothetical protein